MKKILFTLTGCLLATAIIAAPLQSVTLINDNPPEGDILIFSLPSTVKAEVAPGMSIELGSNDIRYLSDMKGKIHVYSRTGINYICGQTIKDESSTKGKSTLVSDEPDYLFEGKVVIKASSIPDDQGIENSCTFQAKA